MSTARIESDTRTIHTVSIIVPDDVMAKWDTGDEIEVVLFGRSGRTSPKKLTYRDRVTLMGGS